MKRLFRFLVRFLLIGVLLVTAGFLLLALYYRSSFPVNTWINGVYCTGKSVEQVNEELIDAQEASVIYIVDASLACWEIKMEDADVRPDYSAQLQTYLRKNSLTGWLDNLQEPVESEITAGKYVMDERKLRECFEALPFVAEERAREKGVTLIRSEEGYALSDGNAACLDCEKAYAYLKDCLENGRNSVRLLEGGCYEDNPDSDADILLREIWAKISAFTERSGRIVYDMGKETVALTSGDAANFLAADPGGIPSLDEKGGLVVSMAAVQDWVARLAAAYDTCDTERGFTATRGDVVTVKYVTYGTKLDVEAETEYLLEMLETDAEDNQPHIPAYKQKGYVRGLDDIGGTYIEVDMTNQKMYYYVEGVLTLETDVVTGDTSRRRGTPEGINYVHSKNRNCTLRGSDYESFVKYWVPVNGGIGIHDASWRSQFGGEIYKRNGSHGCINTPTDVMAELYDMIEVGIPVIMFY